MNRWANKHLVKASKQRPLLGTNFPINTFENFVLHQKMSEKDREIDNLKKRIENLEQRNDTVTAMLQKQIKFSVNVAEIVFKMDELLAKKQEKIQKLEANFSALEEFYADDVDIEVIDVGEGSEQNAEEIACDSNVEIIEHTVSEEIKEHTTRTDCKSVRKSVNNLSEFEYDAVKHAYNCPHENCSYSSHWPHRVKRHLAVHQTEKPFECPKCNYRSKYRSSMQRHIKNDSCVGAWAELEKRNRSRNRKRNSISAAITSPIVNEVDCNDESLVELKKKRKTLG